MTSTQQTAAAVTLVAAMMVAAVGTEHAAREMRKHVAWYIKGLPNSARVREQVNRTRTAEAMSELLHAYLGELAAHRDAFAQDVAEQREALQTPSPTHAAG